MKTCYKTHNNAIKERENPFMNRYPDKMIISVLFVTLLVVVVQQPMLIVRLLRSDRFAE